MADTVNGFCPGPRLHLSGRATGPLAGLTFAVKDLIDVAGVVTGGGNPDWLRTHAPATATAPAVQRLLDAGAHLVGKTITDELAFSLDGINAHYGTPINTRCPDRLPGGSSSGSASVVAAGLVDFALGTDTGGSVRMPASFCGLYGMRPSHGRISLARVLPFAPSYDTIGWFARDAARLAEIGRVLIGVRPTTPITRLCVAADAFLLAEPQSRGALRAVAAELGATEEVSLFGGEPDTLLACYRVLQGAEVKQGLGPWVEETRPLFGPLIAARFADIETITEDEIAHFHPVRQRIAERLRALVPPGTALLLPTGPSPALPLQPTAEEFGTFYGPALTLTSSAGHAGLPQLSVPAAEIDDRPIGLSLIGARNEDLALLSWAEQNWATREQAASVLE